MRLARILFGVGTFLMVLLTAPAAGAQGSGVNDFSFESFDADYYLTRDADRHSHLRIEENLVAEFPDYDQNHGIERAIPQTYDGHRLRLKIETVTDSDGRKLHYEKRTSNDHTVLRIGDADTYVHGRQTYRIVYNLQDVTKGFDGHDEIFWNTNGTQWLQPFGSVTARLHIDRSIAASYTGRNRCVMGSLGANEPCSATVQDRPDGGKDIAFDAGRRLEYGHNMSFVAAFQKGTFATYTPTTWERIFPTLMIIWLVLNSLLFLGSLFFAIKLWRRYGRPEAGRGTIVPEYLPPKDASVLIAGTLLGKSGVSVTAQILDLAVRHYLKIYEVQEKRWFRKSSVYVLEIVKDPASLRIDEQHMLVILFGKLETGRKVTTKELGRRLQSRIQTFIESNGRMAVQDGWYINRAEQKKRLNKIGIGLLIASILLLSPGLFVGAIILFVVVASLKPLSQKGVHQVEYLKGLRMYIKLAEAERLRILQSPEGAEKLPAHTDPANPRQLVKLYERLLPYAILFGLEKQWIKQFAGLYEQPPEWYAGNWATFNAAVFASSLGNFNAVSGTTFAPPASSGSSGFSGGSGGGGGGGGGGGW